MFATVNDDYMLFLGCLKFREAQKKTSKAMERCAACHPARFVFVYVYIYLYTQYVCHVSHIMYSAIEPIVASCCNLDAKKNANPSHS